MTEYVKRVIPGKSVIWYNAQQMEKILEDGKPDMESKLKKRLLALTWDDLRAWSDARSVERGRGYLSRVEPPVLFPDGGLVAEVHGSDDYFAKLRVDASGRLEGVCTCPVGVRCKHCVALALAAAKRLKAGDDFPEADLVSRRWKRAAEDLEGPDGDFDCEDDLDGEWKDDDAEAEGGTRAVSVSVGNAGGRAADARKRADIVAAHLASLDETELRALADELLSACPDVRPYLKHKLEMAHASTADLVRRARQAIKDATYGYYDHWDRRSGHDEVPDYSLVREYFGRLRDAGDVRALMELGDLLKRRANEQEERSNDEDGEIGDQVAACMDIVAEAVMASDMDVREKIEWEDAIHAGDDFCMLDGMEVSYRTALKADRKTWGLIADDLMKRAARKDDAGWKFRVDRVRICEALERAGRAEEAVACLKKAAEGDADASVELADLLCRLGRRAEAEDACRKGLAARAKLSDTYGVNVIRMKLRELLVLDRDWKAVAASDLDAYLARPYIGDYKTLKASCGKARCWPRVRSFVLSFLETGCAAAGTKANWPLPQTGVPPPKAAKPNVSALLEIALEEKRGTDAWALYGRLRREAKGAVGGYGYAHDDFGWRVADAVAKELPEESLKIWDRQIRANVASAHESCYQTICRALEKMRPVMVRLGKGDDWKTRVAELRTEYKRRPKFVAMLDALTSGRGASSRIADW